MDSASFIFGCLSGVLIYGIIGFFLIDGNHRYKSLIRQLKYLIEDSKQIVTVTDLVLKTELSPKFCRKFLNRLVVELDGDVQYTDSGKLFYQFPSANSLQPTVNSNYRELVSDTRSLVNSNEGIVMLTDLVLNSRFSPQECREFLDGLVEELNGKVGTTDEGTVYYHFPKLQKSDLKKISRTKSLMMGD